MNIVLILRHKGKLLFFILEQQKKDYVEKGCKSKTETDNSIHITNMYLIKHNDHNNKTVFF